MPLPNSLPWMESVDAKMIRALEHLETLEKEAMDFLRGTEPTVILKTDPAEPLPWIVSWVADPIPPIRLSVLAGDCVHNLRSALDNLVCGLAKTVDRSCKCRGIAFPICSKHADWKDSDLKGVPISAQKSSKRCNPATTQCLPIFWPR